jgi:hypothetical protein
MKSTTKMAIVGWAIFYFSIVLRAIIANDIIESGAYKYGTIVVTTIAIFAWFLADAKANHFEPSPLLRIAVVASAAIALPYYRFRYMGTKRGFIFLAKVVVFACLVILGAGATVMAIYEAQAV